MSATEKTITAIVTTYRRPQALPPQLEAVRGQSVRPVATWAWANAPQPKLLAALEAAGLDRLVTCSDNSFFHGRFALALLAATEYVAIFDDDTVPGANWLANCLRTMEQLEAAGTQGILGTAGIRLAGAGYAERTMHGWQRPCDEPVEVDLVGQGWFLKTEWIRHLFADRPVIGTNGEDIELSARAWRLGGIRSFCPPHPAGDQSQWGSTRGMELGLDEVAASRRQEHLAERDEIVRVEIAAGWQPMFMRQGGDSARIGPPGESAAPSSFIRQKVDQCAELSEIEAAPERFAEGSLGRIECGEALVRCRDPLSLLRQGRRCLAPARRGVVSARIANVRHHAVVSGLLAGSWEELGNGNGNGQGNGKCGARRYYTRREIEKLFFRAGLDARITPVGNAELNGRRQQGASRVVGIGPLQITAADAEQGEEFFVEAYDVAARPRPRPDYGLTSIVIVTFNQLEFTRACLASIRFLTDEPFELIMVDNGSTDGTLEYLGTLEGVTVIANPENRGFPAGANQGIQASRGRQVLLLNNDVLVTTGWLEAMLGALHGQEEIGLIGPCTNCASGPQQVVQGYDDLACLDGFAWQQRKRHAGQVEETDRLVGFCLLIKRAVIDRVGLLDERFGIGNFEDDDFCLRARQAGFQALIAREAYIHHFGHASFQGNGIDLNGLLAHNRQLFDAKWSQTEAASNDVPVQPTSQVPDGGANPADPGRQTNRCKLSLCLIARDNERTIEACLASIKPWVDEMIVVDTGSKDQTPAICERLGAKVFHFPWCDDFSAARNESLRHATGQWLFWMDSDDVIDEANGRKLRGLVESLCAGERLPLASTRAGEPLPEVTTESILGCVVQVRCPREGPDGSYDFTVVDHCKLLRNRPDLRFEHRIHEQIMPAINRAGGQIVFTDLFVVHAGSDQTPEGRRGKLIRDLRLLRADLRERPKHPFILFNLGMTFDEMGRHAKAVRYLWRSLAASAPQESQIRKVYALLVNSLAQDGQLDSALAACREGLEKFPDDAELLFRLGTTQLQQGQAAEAVGTFKRLLILPPERYLCSYDRGIRGFKARQNLAVAYEGTGDLGAAEDQWRVIIVTVPAYQEGWLGLAENLLQQGRAQEAVELAGEMRSRPEIVDGWSASGGTASLIESKALAQAGRPAEAIALLEGALAQYPDDEQVGRQYCQLLFEHVGPAEAAGALGAFVERYPQDAAAWHNLGTAHLRLQVWQSAVDAFRRSLELRPNWPKTLSALNTALRQLGRQGRAERPFNVIDVEINQGEQVVASS
ncbi:MAG: glycosyltransferase [Pirellulales bacterium]